MTIFDFFSCTIIGTKKDQNFVKFALWKNTAVKIYFCTKWTVSLICLATFYFKIIN